MHGLYIQLASPHNNVIACYGAARMHTLVSWHLVTTNICTQKLQDSLLYARSRPSLLVEETVHPATERYTKGLKKHHVDQSSTTYLFICLQIHVVFPWRYCIYLYIYLYTNRHIYSHIYIYPRFTLHSRFLFVGAPLHIQVGLRNPLQNSYYPRPYKSYKP